MRLLFALLLGLGACRCPSCPPPSCPPSDMAAPQDLASRADLPAPDLSCIRCDAVTNPCPALGLSCDPAAGCCSASPH